MQYTINVPTFEFEGKKRVDLSNVAEQMTLLPPGVLKEILHHLLIQETSTLRMQHPDRSPYFAAHLMLHELTSRGVISAGIQLNETP